MGFNLKDFAGGILRLVAKTNPVTAVLADALLPARVAGKTGESPDLVEKIIQEIQRDGEMIKALNEHEKDMAELQIQAEQIEAGNLQALDTGEGYSFLQGLLGSPRRFGVTVLSAALGWLIAAAGTRAIFVGAVAKDPEGLAMVLKFGGATLFGLAGAYVSKYWGKGAGGA